jgi:hypothetical protein
LAKLRRLNTNRSESERGAKTMTEAATVQLSVDWEVGKRP